jgi:hypothetical protein
MISSTMEQSAFAIIIQYGRAPTHEHHVSADVFDSVKQRHVVSTADKISLSLAAKQPPKLAALRGQFSKPSLGVLFTGDLCSSTAISQHVN